MYAGGTQPAGPDCRSRTPPDYPNDLPAFDYDFHAPIGEAGRLAAGPRRRCAASTRSWPRSATGLAPMPSSFPAHRPTSVDDAETLRWAVRSDGTSGLLFIAWQQPHVPLGTDRDVRFRDPRRDGGGSLVLPSRPVDMPAGTIARWPLRLELGGVRLDWATASALTVLPGADAAAATSSDASDSLDASVPTLVLVAEPGIPVEFATAASVALADADAGTGAHARGMSRC